MSALLSLVYVSSARVPLDEPALERLLQSARIRNQQDGLTGVLLYHDGNFIQYLEGPALTVNQTYQRIARDPAHGNLIELLLEPITERSFTGWDMGFPGPPPPKCWPCPPPAGSRPVAAQPPAKTPRKASCCCTASGKLPSDKHSAHPPTFP